MYGYFEDNTSRCNIIFGGNNYGFESYGPNFYLNNSPRFYGDVKKIPTGIRYISFAHSYYFNGEVTFHPDWFTKGKYNDEITVGMYNAFWNCGRFNSPLNIPAAVTSLQYALCDCTRFNSPIIIRQYGVLDNFYEKNLEVNARNMFQNCIRFNSSVTIGDNTNECAYMFVNCTSFNSTINFGNNITNCYRMFHNCSFYNKPINSRITNRWFNCSYMLANCERYNSPIVIQYGHTANISSTAMNMLEGASNFNNIIKFERAFAGSLGRVYINNMLANCINFNTSLDLGDITWGGNVFGNSQSIYNKNGIFYYSNVQSIYANNVYANRFQNNAFRVGIVFDYPNKTTVDWGEKNRITDSVHCYVDSFESAINFKPALYDVGTTLYDASLVDAFYDNGLPRVRSGWFNMPGYLYYRQINYYDKSSYPAHTERRYIHYGE